MRNILFVYEQNSPTAELVKRLYEAWLLRYGHDVNIKYVLDSKIRKSDIVGSDVIVLIRGVSELEKYICKIAKELGKFIILHIDDDMLTPPKEHIQAPVRTKALEYNIINSDVVITNPYLISKYSGLSKTGRVITVDTPIDGQTIVEHKDNKDIIKLVYPAAADHAWLFEEYVLPAIIALPNSVKSKVEIYCIGNKPKVNNVSGIVVRFIDHMSMQQYEIHMKQANYDIGFAPIYDSDFCKSKYFNKYLNYAQYGIIGVYSNMPPYTYVVKDGVNGFLCDNSKESWANAIEKLITNYEEMGAVRESEYKSLKERFNINEIIDQFNKAIPELGSYEDKTKKRRGFMCLKIRWMVYYIKERTYVTFAKLNRYGLGETIKHLKAHIRSKKRYGNLENSK